MKITKEGKWYVAVDDKTNVATQAKTRKEAEKKLKEALALYYEDDDKWKLRPEYVEKIKKIEKKGKFIPIKNVKEWFRKMAEEG